MRKFYRLLKDIPEQKAGMIYIEGPIISCGGTKFTEYVSIEPILGINAFHGVPDIVVLNPEWFEQVQPNGWLRIEK